MDRASPDASPILSTVLAVGRVSAALRAWRYRGEIRLTAIVKATFGFERDAIMSRVDPQPTFAQQVHYGKSPGRSVRFSSDLAPYLARADVLLTGHAHAAPGAPAGDVAVRLGLFEGARPLLDKSLLARRPAGVDKLALVYENAYGGFGFQDNPFGAGATPGSDPPTLVDPASERRTCGFAPIGVDLPARRKLRGATPAEAIDRPIAELPDDFDWGYFQAAPLDQQIGFLRGDEWIVIDGIDPAQSRLHMRLPSAVGRVRIHGLSRFGVVEGQPLSMSADTLRIDGDDRLCSVTWRGSFAVGTEAALYAARLVAGVELPGEPIAWPSLDELDRLTAPRPTAPSVDLAPPAFDGTLMLSDQDLVPSETDLAATIGLEAALSSFASPLPVRAPRPGGAILAAPVAPTPRAVDWGETVTASSPDELPRALPFDRGVSSQPLPVPESPAPVVEAPAEPVVAAPAAPAEIVLAAPAAPAPAVKAPAAPAGDRSPWAAPVAAPVPVPARAAPPPPKVDIAGSLYRRKKS